MATIASNLIRTINLKKCEKGLGFIISNQFPCIVSSVNQNTAASEAGLKSGDEILEINSIDVSQSKHDEVVKIILSHKQPVMSMKVRAFYPVQKNIDSTQNQDKTKRDIINKSICFSINDSSTVVSNSYCEEIKNTIQHNERSPLKQLTNNSNEVKVQESYTQKNDLNSFNSLSPSIVSANCQKFTPLKRSPSQPISGYCPPTYNVIAFYYHSVDIPYDLNLRTSSLSTINECVTKIKQLNNKPSLVHLMISSSGVKLISPFGNEIDTYPLRTIVFSSVCAEDKRFFSFVTENSLLDNSISLSAQQKCSPKLVKSRIICLHACHIFMVDCKLSSHSDHTEIAGMFKLTCTPSLKFDGCQEFPSSPSYILQELNAFFKERKNVRKGIQSFFIKLPEELPAPDKDVIDSTIERINRSLINSPTRNTQKLMVSPPSSLVGMNEEEKLCLINEIQQNQVVSQKNSKTVGKSEPSVTTTNGEKIGTGSLKKGNDFSKKWFPRMEFKKPPMPRKVSNSKKTFGFSKLNTQSEHRCSNIKDQENKKAFGLLNVEKRDKEQVSSGNKKARSSSEGMVIHPSECVPDIVHRKGTPPLNPKYAVKSPAPERENSVLNKKGDLWSRSFETLLADGDGIKCFQEFLKKEFSEENLMFWIACEDFLKLKDINKMKESAKEIFNNYLSSKAPYLVNVNLSVSKKVEQQLDSPSYDLFSAPQQQVFQLMKFDSYPRFIKSDWYKECINAENRKYGISNHEELKKVNSQSNEEERKNIHNSLVKTGKVKSPELKQSTEIIQKGRSFSTSAVEQYNTISSSPRNMKDFQLWDGSESLSASGLLRVILPDGTSTMITAVKGVTLREVLKEVQEKKHLVLQLYDVTMGRNRQICNLDADITSFKENVLFLEKRVLFRFDLPNGRSVGVNSNPNKTLFDVLQPVMRKNGFDISNFNISVMDSKSCLALNTIIKNVENKRLITKRIPKRQSSQSSLDSAKSPVLSDFRASFRKLRSSSFIKDEKNIDGKNEQTLTKKISNEMKHFLLGRSKSAGHDSTAALLNVIKKSSNRLEDQRGVIVGKLELPEFLKVSTPCSTPLLTRSFSVTTSPSHLFKDATHELNVKLSESTNTFCSIQSWSDIPINDRSIIDSSFVSKDSINSNLSQGSDQTKDIDVSLSQSDSNLMKRKLIRKHSAPPFRENYCNVYKNDSQNNEIEKYSDSRIGFTNVSARPKPINVLDEIAILKALNEDSDFEVIEVPSDVMNESFHTPNGSFTDNSFLANFTPPTPLCNRLAPTTTPECSEVSYRSSIDLDSEGAMFAEYSGATFGTYHSAKDHIHIRDSSIVPMTTSATFSVHDSIFESNSIPTPEKSKLLNGETIRGRQNEKISFV